MSFVHATEIQVGDRIRFANETLRVIDVTRTTRDSFIRLSDGKRSFGVLMSGQVKRVSKAAVIAADLKVGDPYMGGIVVYAQPHGAHWIKLELDRTVLCEKRAPTRRFVLRRDEKIREEA